jgi:hypothetical protein
MGAGDAEKRQRAAGVAGVAAQGRGDVAVPAGAQDADGEVAQAGMAHGGLPLRVWKASSAKVVSRIWGNASASSGPGSSRPGRLGRAWAAVRLVTA